MKVIEIKSNSQKPKMNSTPKKVKETNPHFEWYKSDNSCWVVINEYEIKDDSSGEEGKEKLYKD